MSQLLSASVFVGFDDSFNSFAINDIIKNRKQPIQDLHFRISEGAGHNNHDCKKYSPLYPTILSNFLELMLESLKKKELVALKTISFDNDFIIDLREAQLILKLLKYSDSPYLTIQSECTLTQDAFQYLLEQQPISDNRNVKKLKQNKNNRYFATFQLVGSGITNDHVKCLDQVLFLSTMTHLSLKSSAIHDEGCIVLAGFLCNNSILISLDLWNNYCSDAGATAFADMLSKNTHLECLDLGNNQIGGNGVKDLAQSLTVNKTLKGFHLADTAIENEALYALADMLRVNTSLEELALWGNMLGEDDSIDGARYLAEQLQYNTSLEFLDLSISFCDGSIIPVLVQSVQGRTTPLNLNLNGSLLGDSNEVNSFAQCNSPLLSLDIGANQLNANHIKALVLGIQQGTFNIKSLELFDFHASNDIIGNLFQAIADNKESCSLSKLALDGMHGVTSLGIQKMFDLLPLTNLHPLSLNFYNNNNSSIGNDEIQKLASYLNDTQLHTLELQSIGMQDLGLIALAKALQTNTKLISLALYKNRNLTILGKKELRDSMKYFNMTLKTIELNDCGDSMLDDEIYFYTELNGMTQRQSIMDPNRIPLPYFSIILQNCNFEPSILFWVLQTRPDLIILHAHCST